jgi:hypothetical protein
LDLKQLGALLNNSRALVPFTNQPVTGARRFQLIWEAIVTSATSAEAMETNWSFGPLFIN